MPLGLFGQIEQQDDEPEQANEELNINFEQLRRDMQQQMEEQQRERQRQMEQRFNAQPARAGHYPDDDDIEWNNTYTTDSLFGSSPSEYDKDKNKLDI